MTAYAATKSKARKQKDNVIGRSDRAHAYYPLSTHEIIITEILPKLRKAGIKKTIQDIVSEGVDLAVIKYLGELARREKEGEPGGN